MKTLAKFLSFLLVFAFVACSDDDRSYSSRPSDDLSSSVETYDSITNTLKDLRDNKVYKTVKIGSQIWMAENLNYKSEGSACYNDDTSYCDTYGRLYSWSVAMDSVAEFSENGKGCGSNVKCEPVYPVRGVCPAGWHLPSVAEWVVLFDYVEPGSKPSLLRSGGKKLKAASGWMNNGSDEYGFSALPGGNWFDNAGLDDPKYADEGVLAVFWTVSNDGEISEFSGAEAIRLYDEADYPYVGGEYKYYKYSVRCVKD